MILHASLLTNIVDNTGVVVIATTVLYGISEMPWIPANDSAIEIRWYIRFTVGSVKLFALAARAGAHATECALTKASAESAVRSLTHLLAGLPPQPSSVRRART